MILILSTSYDTDSQLVLDWLKHYNANFVRLNDEDLMTGKTIIEFNPQNIESNFIINNGIKILLSEITVVWFRKFGFLHTYENVFGRSNDLTRYLYTEFSILRTLFLKSLDKKKWLNKRINMPSKFEVLTTAYNCGLVTPQTIITNNKKNLTNTFQEKSIISKSLNESKHIKMNDQTFSFFTTFIETLKDIQLDTFTPSLFQEYIDKKYELRIFYLDGKFYSMAIFSQMNEKTKIDFRNYDMEYPNRRIPYKLPKEIEKKLDKMMQVLGLNTGSIDMILTKKDEYVFLEVNPSGQFGMTSLPCNYNLHKKVAEKLIEFNNERQSGGVS